MTQYEPGATNPGNPLLPTSPAFARVGPPAREVVGDNAMNLRDWLRLMRRRSKLVVGAVVIGIIAAYFVASRRVPEYRSNAVVTIGSKGGGVGGAIGALGGIGSVLGVTGASDISSQLELLRSRQVGGQVVDATGLRIQWQKGERHFPLGLLEEVQVDPEAPRLRFTLDLLENEVVARADGREARAPYGAPVDLGVVRFVVAERPEQSEDEPLRTARLEVVTRNQAIDIFLGNFFTRQRDRTNIVDVGYTATDPVRSQRVANTAAEIFRVRTAEKAKAVNERQMAMMAEQIAKNDSLLMQTQTLLAGFQSGEELFSSSAQAQARQGGLLELQIEREEKDAERRTLQTLLAQLKSSENSANFESLLSHPTVMANPIVSQLYTNLVNYQTTRDTLTAGRWGRAESNPDVVRANELIQTTRDKLIDAMGLQVQVLDAQISTLEKRQVEATGDMRELPSADAQQVRLEQLIAGYGEMGLFLRQEYTKLRMAGLVDDGGVEIVDLALPGWSLGTGLLQTMVFGVLLGLVFGGGGAVLLEYSNTSIRRRDEVERVLQMPPLAVIPQFFPASARRLPIRIAGLRNGNGNGNGHPALPGEHRELVTASNADSLGAEAYRTLRTNLIFSQAVQSLKTIVVTSPAGGEGRTTVAANLAATFAQQGMRVALVDCDLRRSRLHALFSVPREPGLTQLLLGDRPMDDVVHATGVSNLSVIPAGTASVSPSEILGSAAMRQALDQLSERFDLVVLDTPPILAAAAGTAVLAAEADGVLMVLRAGQTEREAAQQAVQQLATVGARMVGAVLNDPDAALFDRAPREGATV